MDEMMMARNMEQPETAEELGEELMTAEDEQQMEEREALAGEIREGIGMLFEDGWTSEEDQLTIAAMVPEARHAAASAPATTKRASMEATERMDDAPARSSSGSLAPWCMP